MQLMALMMALMSSSQNQPESGSACEVEPGWAAQ
jgi:hypothetical protein